MTKTVIIYASCRDLNASGDYSLAGSMATDLLDLLHRSNEDAEVILATSREHLPSYTRLYGAPNREGTIHLGGLPCRVAALDDLPVNLNVSALICANPCDEPEGKKLLRVMSPQTRFIIVGAANNPFQQDQISWKSCADDWSGFSDFSYYYPFDRCVLTHSGIGPYSIGLANSQPLIEPPQAAQQPGYGFVYIQFNRCSVFSFGKDLQAISQYRDLTRYEHFTLVNCEPYLRTDNQSPTLTYASNLSNQAFRSTLNSAGPIVMVTGVGSALEAMESGKFLYYQWLSKNELFADSVQSHLLGKIGTDPNAKTLEKLIQYSLAAKPLSEEAARFLRLTATKKPELIQWVAQAGKALVEGARGKLGNNLFGLFQHPSPANDLLRKVRKKHRRKNEIELCSLQTCLRRAAAAGDLYGLKVLLEVATEADLNAVDTRFGRTALQWARHFNQPGAALLITDRLEMINKVVTAEMTAP